MNVSCRICALILCLFLSGNYTLSAQVKIDSIVISHQNPPNGFGLNNVKLYFDYNSEGKCVREEYYSLDGTYLAYVLFAYHSNGHLQSKSTYTASGELASKNTYNSNGQRTSFLLYENGQLIGNIETSYDQNGNITLVYYEAFDEFEGQLLPTYRIAYSWDENNLVTQQQDEGYSISSGWEPISRGAYTNGIVFDEARRLNHKYWLYEPLYEPESGTFWELQYDIEYDWNASLAFGCSPSPTLRQTGWYQLEDNGDFIFEYGEITNIEGPISCDAETGKVTKEVKQRLDYIGGGVYYDVYCKTYTYGANEWLTSSKVQERSTQNDPWEITEELYQDDSDENLVSYIIIYQEDKSIIQRLRRQFDYDYSVEYEDTWKSVTVDQLFENLLPDHLETYSYVLNSIKFSTFDEEGQLLPGDGDWVGDGEIVVSFSDATTAISDVNTLDMDIIPNPVSDHLTVRLPDDVSGNGAILNLYNAVGALVLNASVRDNEQINIGQFSSGLYFYSIHFANQTKSGKLIKE